MISVVNYFGHDIVELKKSIKFRSNNEKDTECSLLLSRSLECIEYLENEIERINNRNINERMQLDRNLFIND